MVQGQNRQTMEMFENYMTATNYPWAPWKVIDGSEPVRAQLAAADWLYGQIQAALQTRPVPEWPEHTWPLEPVLPLRQVPLDKTLDEKTYHKQLKQCR